MSYKVDFHVHSYYSDGTMKPTELVRKYKDEEYDIISITDHDGIDGVSEAVIAGEALKIQVVPGIEFSTEFNGTSLHMLGYYIDVENEELKSRLTQIRVDRDDRNARLLKLLQEQGYEICSEDLRQRPSQKYIGKPNFALALAAKGYIENPKEAFKEGQFLESYDAKKIKKDKISTEESIALINGAKGMPVLAHPMKIKEIGEKGSPEFFEQLDKIVRALKKLGLKGIECFHPSADHEQALKLAEMAEKYHLHMTEGSDYHGPEFE